mmetsp:Transcript_45912/g.102986  ORF Transcript_45912/g.102986 Transcript_45912/m.102986 type:complete len:548 (+) Transcript_45912:60-1703(+)
MVSETPSHEESQSLRALLERSAFEAEVGGMSLVEEAATSKPRAYVRVTWRMRFIFSLVAVLAACLVISLRWEKRASGLGVPSPALAGDLTQAHQDPATVIRLYGLTGVNLGGWLCLEDWFFSGNKGKYVASMHAEGQGYSFPPLVTSVSKPWTSEGLLTRQLADEHGAAFVLRAFADYRASFISAQDLREIKSLGLNTVRLPITWAAFADVLSPLDPAYRGYDADLDIALVPDPFYKDEAAFVTISRKELSLFFHQAQQHGLRVLLDLHAFPGGASHGTYNGVWPLKCAFWTEYSRVGLANTTRLRDIGLWIVKAMVTWIEGLDVETRGVLAGVTFMNEPGHMNRWKNFAPEKAILDWLEEASRIYFSSSLPLLGIQLYMNLVETAFQDFDGMVVPWFRNLFSLEERQTVVVADVHYYLAWDKYHCDGRWDGQAAFNCQLPKSQGVVASCAAGNARNMKQRWRSVAELVAVSEFSMGTADQPDFACKDPQLLTMVLKQQLASFGGHGFQTMFWTWKLPHAPDFEPGWSLQWLVRQANATTAAALQRA